MDTFTLKISNMVCYPSVGHMTDVAFEVCWSYEGTDGTFTTAMSGSTKVPPPTDPNDFVPYDQLTEEMVLGWVKEFTPAQVWPEYEAKMSAWLAAQHNPPIVTPPLPWAQPDAPAAEEPTPDPAPEPAE